MLHIIQKLNKPGPLLQVAKLSVYNLSNKQVFYSGMVFVVFANPELDFVLNIKLNKLLITAVLCDI